MPIGVERANAISDAVIAGQTYPQIADQFYPGAVYKSQTVYNCVTQPTVSGLIQEKLAKIHSRSELQQITSRTIEKVTQFIDANELDLETSDKLIKVIDKQKDYLELQGKFNGDFVTKSINLTVVAQAQVDKAQPLSTQALIDAITYRIQSPDKGDSGV
jgi:hypothetical protein